MKLKLLIFILIATCLIFLGYKGYNNYQRNEKILDENNEIVFSDYDSQFKIKLTSDSDYDFSASLLDSISQIKEKTVLKFLAKTEEKIVFAPTDKDTLEIKIENEKFSYSSSLKKGIYDENFNDLLVETLVPLLISNNLENVKIFTLTPTKWKNVPPPPGTAKNFDSVVD